MATVDELHVVKFPSTNGNIDACTHRFAISRDTAASTLAQIYTDLEAFYTTTQAGISTLGGYLHPVYSRAANAASITSYDITAHLAGTPFGAPIGATGWTAPTVDTGGGVSAQLAGVLEYEGVLDGVVEFGAGGIRPRSRRRGRIFFGALAAAAITNGASSPFDTVMSANFITVAKAAMVQLKASAHAGAGWSVWSRKDAALYPIVGGWIDNTVHVQRRRQDDAGVKTLWP